MSSLRASSVFARKNLLFSAMAGASPIDVPAGKNAGYKTVRIRWTEVLRDAQLSRDMSRQGAPTGSLLGFIFVAGWPESLAVVAHAKHYSWVYCVALRRKHTFFPSSTWHFDLRKRTPFTRDRYFDIVNSLESAYMCK